MPRSCRLAVGWLSCCQPASSHGLHEPRTDGGHVRQGPEQRALDQGHGQSAQGVCALAPGRQERAAPAVVTKLVLK